jgi:hypothetical protein
MTLDRIYPLMTEGYVLPTPVAIPGRPHLRELERAPRPEAAMPRPVNLENHLTEAPTAPFQAECHKPKATAME